MARRRVNGPIDPNFNFIIMLGIVFFLVVSLSVVLTNTATDLRARAACGGPTPDLPTTSCEAGWKFERDVNGCPVFQCPSVVNPQK